MVSETFAPTKLQHDLKKRPNEPIQTRCALWIQVEDCIFNLNIQMSPHCPNSGKYLLTSEQSIVTAGAETAIHEKMVLLFCYLFERKAEGVWEGFL